EAVSALSSYPIEAGVSYPGAGQLPRLALSRDGTKLACGKDNPVLVWALGPEQVAGLPRVLTGHTGPVCDQAFRPDGQRIVTASADETVRIWDAATGEEVLSFRSPFPGMAGYRGIDCLAFSPDGQRLAGAHGQDFALWDAA